MSNEKNQIKDAIKGDLEELWSFSTGNIDKQEIEELDSLARQLVSDIEALKKVM